MSDTRTDKERITAAFKTLRKQGMIAKQNFLCCGGCASSAISRDAKSLQGCVFYHRQAKERSFPSGSDGKLAAPLYLQYGANNGTGVDDKLVGKMVKQALVAEGLKVEWNGDPDKAIKVLA